MPCDSCSESRASSSRCGERLSVALTERTNSTRSWVRSKRLLKHMRRETYSSTESVTASVITHKLGACTG